MTELERLSALRAGHLPVAEAEALRERLSTDPELQALWARLDEVSLDLADLPLDAPPAGLDDAVLDQLQYAPTPAGRTRSTPGRGRALAAAALLVAGTAAASSLITAWWMTPEQDSPDAVAEAPPEAPPENDSPDAAPPGPDTPTPHAPQPVATAPTDTPAVDDEGWLVEPPQEPSVTGPAAESTSVSAAFVGRVETALLYDEAIDQRGAWMRRGALPAWARFGGDTACGTYDVLAASVEAGFDDATTRCLRDLAASEAPGARRASFWLLGDLEGELWTDQAMTHLQRWEEPPLAASVAARMQQKQDPRFVEYAELAFPWTGEGEERVATAELYAAWRLADWREGPTRLAWHEAVDQVAAWERVDAEAAQAPLGELIAKMPRPTGCERDEELFTGEIATTAGCMLRIAQDDTYPDRIRVMAANEATVRYAKLGEIDGLVLAGEAHVDAAPGSGAAHLQLAQALADGGRTREAITHAERAIALADGKGSEARTLIRTLDGKVDAVAVATEPSATSPVPPMVEVPDDRCDDLALLEPRSLLGRLSAAHRTCLEARVDDADDAERARASLLLLTDAHSRSDDDRFVRLAEQHLDSLGWDATLAYKVAIKHHWHHQHLRAYALAGQALERPDPAWTGDLRETRLYGLTKLRASAAWALHQRDELDLEATRTAVRAYRDAAEGRDVETIPAQEMCAQLGGCD